MQDTAPIIRRATPADIPRIETLHYVVWEEHRRREAGFDRPPFIEDFTALIGEPKAPRAIWVAERRGHFAGHLACTIHGSWMRGRRISIDELSVLPQHRGNRIGRALLDTALAHRPGRTGYAVAGIWPQNVASRELFLKAGFKEVDNGEPFLGYLKSL